MSRVTESDAPPLGAQPSAVQALLRRAARRSQPPWLHAEVARRMAERLALVRAEPRVVFDWWAALSASRALLQARYPAARIDAVEPSAALRGRSLHAAAAPWWSVRRWGSRRPQVWSDETGPDAGSGQLVWANMMLHWCADPARQFGHWQRALAVDGFLMFSCFGPDTLRELRGLYERLGWPPPAHAFLDMHDLGDALLASGFADPVMDMETLDLSWPDADALLAELRTLGGNAAAQRRTGLATPRWRARLRAALGELAGPDGRLHLRFEIVYGHAFKPLPRAPVAAETRVDVETLRRMARAGRSGPSGP